MPETAAEKERERATRGREYGKAYTHDFLRKLRMRITGAKRIALKAPLFRRRMHGRMEDAWMEDAWPVVPLRSGGNICHRQAGCPQGGKSRLGGFALFDNPTEEVIVFRRIRHAYPPERAASGKGVTCL